MVDLPLIDKSFYPGDFSVLGVAGDKQWFSTMQPLISSSLTKTHCMSEPSKVAHQVGDDIWCRRATEMVTTAMAEDAAEAFLVEVLEPHLVRAFKF